MKYQLALIILVCLFIFSCPATDKPIDTPTDNDTSSIITQTKDTPSTTISETTPKPQVIPPFEIELPKENEILGQSTGDLNKDNVQEKVLVINTDREGDFGIERDILIYKVENDEWKLWNRSTGAVLPSENGGMMGDPFEGVSIENGAIVFKHFGGSRQKWAYTHRFRLQNGAWELIGLTSESISPCEETEIFDYNLSSGRVINKKTYESCDDGDNIKIGKTETEDFVSKPKALPVMNGFSFDTQIYAVNPKTKKCVPSSACYDYEAKNN